MHKTTIYGVLFWVTVIGLTIFFAKPVSSQVKPCVWPNRCVNAR